MTHSNETCRSDAHKLMMRLIRHEPRYVIKFSMVLSDISVIDEFSLLSLCGKAVHIVIFDIVHSLC